MKHINAKVYSALETNSAFVCLSLSLSVCLSINKHNNAFVVASHTKVKPPVSHFA